MNLSAHTVEALRHKATVAGETFDPTDAETNWCLATQNQCETVASSGTVELLSAHTLAMEELENYLDGDSDPSEASAIVRDLCRAGWYEKYDAGAVSTRRIKTRLVDGVRYVTGH